MRTSPAERFLPCVFQGLQVGRDYQPVPAGDRPRDLQPAVGRDFADAGVRHARPAAARTCRRSRAALRTGIGVFDSLNKSATSVGRRARSCGTAVERDPQPPSPPAKAISAAAAASPPSLRSWQARTRPASIAWCSAAKVCLRSGRRRPAARGRPRDPATSGEVRAAQLVLGQADQVEQVAGFFEVHRHGLRHVVDLAQRADQQRRRNGDRLRRAVGRRCSGIRCSGCPCR